MLEEPESTPVGAADRAVIARQLRREPHDLTGVAVRCPFGRPAVIETAPVLSGGEPNPTLLYLTCPTVVAAISGVEAAGGVRRLKAAVRADPHLREALSALTGAYRARRAELLEEADLSRTRADPRLEAGIGGPRGPEVASCLHAYAAALLAVTSGWLSAPLGDDPEETTGGPAGDAGGPPRELWDRVLSPLGEAWCADDRCAPVGAGATERRAVIDVGTISVRLLVADVRDGRPLPLVRRVEVTRMGEGLQPGGTIAPDAAARTSAAVSRFAEEAISLGAEAIWLVGTSAARDAADGATFIGGIGRAAGATAAVLSGREEAALAYAGASLDVPGMPVVLDVGGGSTEVVRMAEGGRIDGVSLQVGAVRATERWIHSDPPMAEEVAAVGREAAAAFASLKDRFGPAAGPLVGVAGTVTTLACLDAGLETYEPDVVHLWELRLDSVRGLLDRLSRLTTAQRAALPCVQTGRAPVIVAGAAVVQAAMETLGYGSLIVSERDLLDGLILHGLAPDGPRPSGTALLSS